MSNRINQSRRNLFSRRKSQVIRPPWSRADVEFTDICTRCDKCIYACETKILSRGDGGFPEVSFSQDECTFCGNCAKVCPEPIFTDIEETPWQIKASIDQSCLANSGIWCQTCKDACDSRAISFTASIGQAPKPVVDTELCNGCGACVAPCPNQSIKLS